MSGTPPSSPERPIHVLVAIADEQWARSLASVLEPAGYQVTTTATAADAEAQARDAQLDTILVVQPADSVEGLELCRTLREGAIVQPAVPIIGITPDLITRTERLRWLQAGAWDLVSLTVGMEELLAELRTYLRAKRNADEAAAGALIDTATGFYNGAGVKRRAEELVAAAVRSHAALACVMFGPERRVAGRAGAAEPGARAGSLRDRLTPLLRAHARLSDTIGWWDDADFAVLAPGTDLPGAAQLARRLATAIEAAPLEQGTNTPALELKVGYEAVTNLHATHIRADDLLARASAALALARRAGGSSRRQGFMAS